MTNQEKYKQAFSVLHASANFSLEAEKMENKAKHRRFKTVVAAVAACVMLVGSAAAAYSADVGGIQRTVQLWIHGDQTAATIQFDGNGSYSMEYTDAEGNTHYRGGGGVGFAPDGTEIPLSEEDLMSELTAPEVEYREDGSVWVYWFDQTLEITDLFEDDVCYLKLERGEETLYMTVKYQNGYATSPRKYVSPWTFN